ncbi:MAG: hypothetical protein ABL908_14490, partial [Hyphomicrobium sp.]
SVAMLLGVMQLVRVAGRRYGWPPEVQRKAVHVATGGYALTLPLLFHEPWPVILLVALTIVVMLLLRHPAMAQRGLGTAIHSVERKSYGDMLFAIAVGFLFFRAPSNPVLFALPVLVLTLSDTAAALAGSAYGKRLFAVEAGNKSLEGVAVFFLVTWIIAMVMLLLMTDIPRLNVVTLSLLIASFGALVEADSWRGFDNLFLPVGLHLFLAAHLSTPPLGLAVIALGFLVAMVSILNLAPRLGLSPHTARTYVVALFLIGCYTQPHNMILPALAVAAHLWARERTPSRSPFPDLDSIAAVAVISLAWMFAGEWFGPSAINFYNMTFAGAAAALVMIGLAGRPRVAALAAAVATAAVIASLFNWIVGLGPEAARWHGGLALPLSLTLLLSLAVSGMQPDLFDRFRSPRIAILAGIVPAIAYLAKVLT